MLEVLNKPEVEYLGPLLVERHKLLEREFRTATADRVFDLRQEIKTLESILTKIDYPFRSTT